VHGADAGMIELCRDPALFLESPLRVCTITSSGLMILIATKRPSRVSVAL